MNPESSFLNSVIWLRRGFRSSCPGFITRPSRPQHPFVNSVKAPEPPPILYSVIGGENLSPISGKDPSQPGSRSARLAEGCLSPADGHLFYSDNHLRHRCKFLLDRYRRESSSQLQHKIDSKSILRFHFFVASSIWNPRSCVN